LFSATQKAGLCVITSGMTTPSSTACRRFHEADQPLVPDCCVDERNP
jgi:hypothetical protein